MIASASHIWNPNSDSAGWRHSPSALTARETGALVGTGRDRSFPLPLGLGHRIRTRSTHKEIYTTSLERDDNFDHCQPTERTQVLSKCDAKVRLQSKIGHKTPSSSSWPPFGSTYLLLQKPQVLFPILFGETDAAGFRRVLLVTARPHSGTSSARSTSSPPRWHPLRPERTGLPNPVA